mgnify:CR=1 FL=1
MTTRLKLDDDFEKAKAWAEMWGHRVTRLTWWQQRVPSRYQAAWHCLRGRAVIHGVTFRGPIDIDPSQGDTFHMFDLTFLPKDAPMKWDVKA